MHKGKNWVKRVLNVSPRLKFGCAKVACCENYPNLPASNAVPCLRLLCDLFANLVPPKLRPQSLRAQALNREVHSNDP